MSDVDIRFVGETKEAGSLRRAWIMTDVGGDERDGPSGARKIDEPGSQCRECGHRFEGPGAEEATGTQVDINAGVWAGERGRGEEGEWGGVIARGTGRLRGGISSLSETSSLVELPRRHRMSEASHVPKVESVRKGHRQAMMMEIIMMTTTNC